MGCEILKNLLSVVWSGLAEKEVKKMGCFRGFLQPPFFDTFNRLIYLDNIGVRKR